jgi:hypothetical protein
MEIILAQVGTAARKVSTGVFYARKDSRTAKKREQPTACEKKGGSAASAVRTHPQQGISV